MIVKYKLLICIQVYRIISALNTMLRIRCYALLNSIIVLNWTIAYASCCVVYRILLGLSVSVWHILENACLNVWLGFV